MLEAMAKRKVAPGDDWPARLKAIRERLRLTRAEAATRAGVSLRAWIYWEDGEHVPHPPYQRLIEQLERAKK